MGIQNITLHMNYNKTKTRINMKTGIEATGGRRNPSSELAAFLEISDGCYMASWALGGATLVGINHLLVVLHRPST